MRQHELTGTYASTGDRERRLNAPESACVETNLEPESGLLGTRSGSPSRRIRRRTTYREIRAHVYAHHGFSPRTGWIAHVKELNGIALQQTHNRHGATRADPCPRARQVAIEEVLRHFGILRDDVEPASARTAGCTRRPDDSDARRGSFRH